MKLNIREKMIGAWPQFSEEYGFLGHLLHSERLLKGISVEKVAEELNLSTYIIQSLETGQLNQTPGFSYMIGFVRTYARYLGLSAKELIDALHQKSSVFRNETVVKRSLRGSQLPNRSVVLGAAFFLVVLFLLYVSVYLKDKPMVLDAEGTPIDAKHLPLELKNDESAQSETSS